MQKSTTNPLRKQPVNYATLSTIVKTATIFLVLYVIIFM
jgi:hypothetical protein